MDDLPIQTALPLPDAPTYFGDTPTCKPNDHERDVKLSWASVPGVNGYRLYRDGVLIASVKENVGIYVDTVAYEKGVTYELEAINADGASEKLTVSSLGC